MSLLLGSGPWAMALRANGTPVLPRLAGFSGGPPRMLLEPWGVLVALRACVPSSGLRAASAVAHRACLPSSELRAASAVAHTGVRVFQP